MRSLTHAIRNAFRDNETRIRKGVTVYVPVPLEMTDDEVGTCIADSHVGQVAHVSVERNDYTDIRLVVLRRLR